MNFFSYVYNVYEYLDLSTRIDVFTFDICLPRGKDNFGDDVFAQTLSLPTSVRNWANNRWLVNFKIEIGHRDIVDRQAERAYVEK